MSSGRERIRTVVRESYADIAKRAAEARGEPGDPRAGCAPGSSCCGTGASDRTLDEVAKALGYTDEDLAGIPISANLGLGCGNPGTFASLQSGEVVVDLGSGAGVDCFIAANRVGTSGFVIGVDMTSEMLARARSNASAGNFDNVEFRLGEIEHLPIADETADVIISNCVINLSPDKPQVFRDSFRILKPGGRLAVSDVVAMADIPDEIRADDALLTGCIAGAERIEDLERMMGDAGFIDIEIRPWDESREFIKDWAPGGRVEDYVVSASIRATKPGPVTEPSE